MASDQQADVMAANVGTRDGSGAADHDKVYSFGCRPWSAAPYPFNTRQYARLLVLRSRVRESHDVRNAARSHRSGFDGERAGSTQLAMGVVT